jgi:hypothetical protein
MAVKKHPSIPLSSKHIAVSGPGQGDPELIRREVAAQMQKREPRSASHKRTQRAKSTK